VWKDKTVCGSSDHPQDCNKRAITAGCGSSRHLQDCTTRDNGRLQHHLHGRSSFRTYRQPHIAAYKGYESVVGVLLDEGASIDAADKDSQTPLHVASRNGHESIVRLLLDQGADTTIVSVRPCLVLVAAIVTTESPSLTPSIRQTRSVASVK